MNSTNGKRFIDTNVLIYAYDRDAGQKCEIAKDILRNLWKERTGLLSLTFAESFGARGDLGVFTVVHRVESSGYVNSISHGRRGKYRILGCPAHRIRS